VLGLRVAELKKLGTVPEKYKDQVSFFVVLEAKIQDILDLGAKGENQGRLAYGQDVFYAIYNLPTVSQHLQLLAVPGDKYSREKLMKTKDKSVELRKAANTMKKSRVDSGARKHTHGGGTGKGSWNPGTGSRSGSGVGASHVHAAATSLTISDCRICKWIDGPGMTKIDRRKPFADPSPGPGHRIFKILVSIPHN
jgi:hypothetical protein